MEVPTEVLQDVVAFVEKTNEVLEKAASQEAQMAQMAPAVVDELVKAGLLDEAQRDKAIITVQDPLKAMESLRKTAAAMAKQPAPASMGRGEEIKTASAQARSNEPYQSEADRIFLQRFGLV